MCNYYLVTKENNFPEIYQSNLDICDISCDIRLIIAFVLNSQLVQINEKHWQNPRNDTVNIIMKIVHMLQRQRFHDRNLSCLSYLLRDWSICIIDDDNRGDGRHPRSAVGAMVREKSISLGKPCLEVKCHLKWRPPGNRSWIAGQYVW